MANDLVRFSATVPEELLAQFDEYAERRGSSSNRSEAIRDLMREKLVQEAMVSPREPVVGSITMVYSHHSGDLRRRLDEIQHENADLIMSTLHVHLDHDTCLEVIAVRGLASKLNELAQLLMGIKGIKYGKLTTAATVDRLKV